MFFYKKINKILILVLIATQMFFILPTEKTSAQAGVPTSNIKLELLVEGVGISTGAIAGTEAIEAAKKLIECTKDIGPGCVPNVLSMDFLTSFASKTLASELVKATTRWVKRGFPSGGPTFVQDLKQFYENEAYKILDFYLDDLLNVDMCDLFPDLKTVISLSGPNTGVSKARCTIDKIRSDSKKFQTDFRKGEWLTFAPSLETNNSAFGLYIATQVEANNKVAKNKEDRKSKLGWAKGFFSFEERVRDDAGNMVNTGRVLTPGSFVVQELNNASFGPDLRNLEIADELDELAAALLQQGISAAFKKATQEGFFQ